MADAGLLDFGRPDTPPRPRAARARTPLVGGRAPIARQASADGAALNAPKREDQCSQLIRYFDTQGYRGATDAEIHRDLKWPVNVITARRADLIADGLVVVRWPNARRRSCATRVKVVTWVASAAVVTKVSLLSRGRHTADAAYGPAAPSTGSSSDHEYEHRTDLSGTDPHPAGHRPRRTGSAGEPQGGETHDGSDRNSASQGTRTPSHTESQQEAQSPLTAETTRDVAFGTRVVLADGQFGQVRMITRAGDVVVYVFADRGVRTLPPASLLDRRAVDGELVQIRNEG